MVSRVDLHELYLHKFGPTLHVAQIMQKLNSNLFIIFIGAVIQQPETPLKRLSWNTKITLWQ